jgi:hypothetical protein
MQIITGLYISAMIPLFVWFVINAILTYKRHYGLTIWGVLFDNNQNSSGGFNKPTDCIIFVTSIYAFCWIVFFVFRFIIY